MFIHENHITLCKTGAFWRAVSMERVMQRLKVAAMGAVRMVLKTYWRLSFSFSSMYSSFM